MVIGASLLLCCAAARELYPLLDDGFAVAIAMRA